MPSTLPALLVKSHKWKDQQLVQNHVAGKWIQPELKSRFISQNPSFWALCVHELLFSWARVPYTSCSHVWTSDWGPASEIWEMVPFSGMAHWKHPPATFPCSSPFVFHADEHKSNRLLKMAKPQDKRRPPIRNTARVLDFTAQGTKFKLC